MARYTPNYINKFGDKMKLTYKLEFIKIYEFLFENNFVKIYLGGCIFDVSYLEQTI